MALTMRITWVGHSTVLIDHDGVRLLTDPVFRVRLLHLRRIGPVDRGELGEIDAVLVSHLHYDHLDLPSLRAVGRSLPVVVPRGAARMLRRRGFAHTVELARGDETRIGPLTIRATHAEHGGRRGLFGADVPAVGYVVSGKGRVYFAGDTDLFDGMGSLAPGLDVALLPVGGWGYRLPPGHLDPRRAAEALRLLSPRFAVPIHWGTYRQLGLSRAPAALHAPADEFKRLAAELAPDVDVRVVPPGGTIELPIGAGATSLER
ncbi:MAG TPA: MBL fold metallo-hydrolase [Gaiellaceae bacterium]|nr:MBL fold metallo-hydrolase [Gaiellaceae bacterium]